MGMKKLAALVMALVLCLCAVSAMADTVTVTDFAGLSGEMTAGGTKTIIIGNNITMANAIEITSGNITLTANSPVTISANDVWDIFTVKGNAVLTLGKNLTVTNDSSILYADNGGKIIVDGANLTATSSDKNMNANLAAVWNNSTLEVKSGSLNGKNGDFVTISLKSGSKAVISGGTVYSESSSAIATQEQNTSLTISGGIVKSDSRADLAAVYARDKATIQMTGGEVVSTKGQGIYTNDSSSANISGGTITAARAAVSAEEVNDASLNVTGGTFSDNSVVKYAQDKLVVKAGDTFAVGSADVKNLVDELVQNGQLLSIEVHSGNADLENIPEGVKITVFDGASAEINGVKTNSKDTVIMPEMVDANNKDYKNDLVYAGTGDVVLKSTDSFANFEKAELYYNGKKIGTVTKENPKNPVMQASDGSIKITVSGDEIAEMYGDYKLVIESKWGAVSGTFTNKEPNIVVNLPQTGDNSSMMLWASMMVIAMVGFAYVSRKTRLN